MRIAVVSGKGGAGKTTITASLAAVWNRACVVADADVEAPNAHLFLAPHIASTEPIYLDVPVLHAEHCTVCGACTSLCRFKAISKLGKKIMVFPDMCHGCGGCFAVCPEDGALSHGQRELGVLERGTVQSHSLSEPQAFIMGKARIGEAMTPPQLRALQGAIDAMVAQNHEADAIAHFDVIMDAPPGVSCPAMTTVRDVDLIILAAEPTPFGFHDFMLAHKAFIPLNKKIAVVMNRSGIEGNEAGDQALRDYCAEHDIPLLAELPFDRQAAEHYAKGQLLVTLSDVWRGRFEDLRDTVQGLDTIADCKHCEVCPCTK
ncbi:MAG: (4Fe-4S)-binding protein [Pseudomonadota bacterium]